MNLNRFTFNTKGFTLVEILVSMSVVALILGLAVVGGNSSRDQLDKVLDDLERGVRFATTESALRNSIVRLNISMSTEPQSYSVEFSSNGALVLPSARPHTEVKSLEEEESEQSEKQKLDKMFSKVKEFQDKERTIDNEDIKIIGVGISTNEKLINGQSASIYFYPTGEKDGSVIYVANDDEVAQIKISPFLEEINREYFPLGSLESGDVADGQISKVEELYQQWLKK